MTPPSANAGAIAPPSTPTSPSEHSKWRCDSGRSGMRRPRDERRPDLPVVAERVDDAAEAPAVLVGDRTHQRRAGGNRALDRSIRVLDGEQQLHRPTAQRLRAEALVLCGLVGDPECGCA